MKAHFSQNALLSGTSYLLVVAALLFINHNLHGQTTSLPRLKDPGNPFFINRVYDMDLESGVICWCKNALGVRQLFTEYKEHTGMGADDEMIEIKSWSDALPAGEDSPAPDFKHTTYQQHYKHVPVEGNEYTEHHKDGYVFATTGFVIEGLNMNVTPAFNESMALNYATEYIHAETYSWESPENRPKGELIILFAGNKPELIPGNYKLAYKFSILALVPHSNRTVYVDALDGTILKDLSNFRESDGSFNHIYYGLNDLDLRYEHNLFAADKWYLFANDQGRNIYTSNKSIHTNWGESLDDKNWTWNQMPFSRGDNYFGNEEWTATAAHHCTQKAWDFYRDVFNRNGINGNSGPVRVIADFHKTGYLNNRDDDYISVYRKDNKYQATYDILGHEFTHGVSTRTYDLKNEKAAGAIGESFGDIFGFMVERYVFGYVRNWTCGEDASTSRDMQNPNAFGHPKYYLESPFWVDLKGCIPTDHNDNCYVHANAGVQNRWFYLLSMGGSQIVNGSTRNVKGIGIDKAARIAFLTMTSAKNYDDVNENFNVVRANSMLFAAKLYGYNSTEHRQVCQAWYAVNVGTCVAAEQEKEACVWTPNERFNHYKTTGQSDLNTKQPKIGLYPNPAKHIIYIAAEEINRPDNESYRLNIIDVQGKSVFSEYCAELNDKQLDIGFLLPGIYFMHISNSNWSHTARFIKQ